MTAFSCYVFTSKHPLKNVLGRDNAHPYYAVQTEIRGLKVHIAALCSSLVSAENGERGKLILGRYQVNAVLKGAEAADLVVCALHHPWDYLVEFDMAENREAIRVKSDLVLRGHLHEPEAALDTRPDGTVAALAAGAAYASRQWPNSFQVIEIDPMHRKLTAHVRKWDNNRWIPARDMYGGKAPEGILRLNLGKRTRAR